MSRFTKGQAVTFRGQSGTVHAVDLTPGMVDVQYPTGLTKRHKAEDVHHAARENTSRHPVYREDQPGWKRSRRRRRQLRGERQGRTAGRDFYPARAWPNTGEDREADPALKRLRAGVEQRISRLLSSDDQLSGTLAHARREVAQAEEHLALTERAQAKFMAGEGHIDSPAQFGREVRAKRTAAGKLALPPQRRKYYLRVADGKPGPNGDLPTAEERAEAEQILAAHAPTEEKPLAKVGSKPYVYLESGERQGTDVGTARSDLAKAQERLQTAKSALATARARERLLELSSAERDALYDEVTHQLWDLEAEMEPIRAQLAPLSRVEEPTSEQQELIDTLDGQFFALLKKQKALIPRKALLSSLDPEIEQRSRAEGEARRARTAQTERMAQKKVKPMAPKAKRREEVRGKGFWKPAAVMTPGGGVSPANFLVLYDPPRFESAWDPEDPEEARELCGNPIDASMYALRLTGDKRWQGNIITRKKMAKLKARWASVRPDETWPEDPVLVAEELEKLYNPGRLKRPNARKGPQDWSVKPVSKEVTTDPELTAKHDGFMRTYYTSEDVRLIQQGRATRSMGPRTAPSAVPLEERALTAERTPSKGRKGAPVPQDLTLAMNTLQAQIAFAQQSMMTPLTDRLALALTIPSKHRSPAAVTEARRSIPVKMRARLAEVADTYEQAVEQGRPKKIRAAGAAFRDSLAQETQREAALLKAMQDRLAVLQSEVGEARRLQDSLEALWEGLTQKADGSPRNASEEELEAAEVVAADLHSRLAHLGIDASHIMSSGRGRVRRGKRSWGGGPERKGPKASRSGTLWEVGHLPSNTFFQKMVYPEDDPNHGADHWVAFRAGRKVPIAQKRLVEEFNPPYTPGSPKAKNPFFSWVRLTRPTATKPVYIGEGDERRAVASPFSAPPLCTTPKMKEMEEMAKQIIWPISQMASGLRWARNIVKDYRDEEQLIKAGDSLLRAAARFANWSQSIDQTLIRVAPGAAQKIPGRKLASLIGQNPENPGGLPTGALAKVIGNHRLPLAERDVGTQAFLLTSYIGPEVSTDKLPAQFAPIAFSPTAWQWKNLQERKAEVLREPDSAEKVRRLKTLEAQLGQTLEGNVGRALLPYVFRVRNPENALAELIVDVMVDAGLLGNPGKSATSRKFFAAHKTATADRIAEEARPLRLFTGNARKALDLRERLATASKEGQAREVALLSARIKREIEPTELTDRLRQSLFFVYTVLGGEATVRALRAAQTSLSQVVSNAGRLPPSDAMETRVNILRAREELDEVLAERPQGESGRKRKERKAARLKQRLAALESEETESLIGTTVGFMDGSPVYYTFNPALFLLTKNFWSYGPPWKRDKAGHISKRGQKLLGLTDTMGRYGWSLVLAYESGIKSSDLGKFREKLIKKIGGNMFFASLGALVQGALAQKSGNTTTLWAAVREAGAKLLAQDSNVNLQMLSPGQGGRHLISRYSPEGEYEGWLADLQKGVAPQKLLEQAQKLGTAPRQSLSELRQQAQAAVIEAQQESAEMRDYVVRRQREKKPGEDVPDFRPIPPLPFGEGAPYTTSRRWAVDPAPSFVPPSSPLAALEYVEADSHLLLSLIQQRMKDLRKKK
jgi:hypothetical protein